MPKAATKRTTRKTKAVESEVVETKPVVEAVAQTVEVKQLEPVIEASEVKELEVKAGDTLPPDVITWEPKNNRPKGIVKTKCIVIDRFNRWHENVMIDLKGRDTSEYTWFYYGTPYAVLVEKNGLLMPYTHTDTVGESSTRLWKAANPEGFKNTFKHTNSLMQKVQIGLMGAIVIGILFMLFVMINQ